MKSSDIAKYAAVAAVAGIAGMIGATSVGAANAQTGANATTTTAAAPLKADGARCVGREPLDDATAAKVKAAAEKAVEGATVKRSGHDRGAGYVAMLLKGDGATRVLVHEDKDFKVIGVRDPASPRHRHHRGARAGARV